MEEATDFNLTLRINIISIEILHVKVELGKVMW